MKIGGSFSFPPPPTSHDLQYIIVTRGFTRLSMKTKYVCRALISLYVNFYNNRTMWSTNLHVKICRWGGGKRAKLGSLASQALGISLIKFFLIEVRNEARQANQAQTCFSRPNCNSIFLTKQ